MLGIPRDWPVVPRESCDAVPLEWHAPSALNTVCDCVCTPSMPLHPQTCVRMHHDGKCDPCRCCLAGHRAGFFSACTACRKHNVSTSRAPIPTVWPLTPSVDRYPLHLGRSGLASVWQHPPLAACPVCRHTLQHPAASASPGHSDTPGQHQPPRSLLTLQCDLFRELPSAVVSQR